MPGQPVGRDDGALIVYDAATFQEVKRLPMRRPVGKYNVWNKINRSEARRTEGRHRPLAHGTPAPAATRARAKLQPTTEVERGLTRAQSRHQRATGRTPAAARRRPRPAARLRPIWRTTPNGTSVSSRSPRSMAQVSEDTRHHRTRGRRRAQLGKCVRRRAAAPLHRGQQPALARQRGSGTRRRRQRCRGAAATTKWSGCNGWKPQPAGRRGSRHKARSTSRRDAAVRHRRSASHSCTCTCSAGRSRERRQRAAPATRQWRR